MEIGGAAEPTTAEAAAPGGLEQPTLDAGPFRLRAFAVDDLDLVREASSDPLIPLITTVPSTYDAAAGRAFVERQWSRAATGEGWSWAIARAGDDRAVGQVGLWPRGDGRASIGYWVGPSARGEGAAAHALAAVCAFAFGAVGFGRLELRIEPWNTASIRTAQRCGFRLDATMPGFQVIGGEARDMAIYTRSAPADPVAPAAGVAQAWRVDRATDADVSSWLEIVAEVEPLFGPMPDFAATLHGKISRHGAWCVRAGDGDPGAAVLGAILLGGTPDEGWIRWLAVRSTARGSGIGAALVRLALERFGAAVPVGLDTFGADRVDGRPARHLYERFGFVAGEMLPPGPDGGTRQRFVRPAGPPRPTTAGA